MAGKAQQGATSGPLFQILYNSIQASPDAHRLQNNGGRVIDPLAFVFFFRKPRPTA
jgi:hypothetical protein